MTFSFSIRFARESVRSDRPRGRFFLLCVRVDRMTLHPWMCVVAFFPITWLQMVFYFAASQKSDMSFPRFVFFCVPDVLLFYLASFLNSEMAFSTVCIFSVLLGLRNSWLLDFPVS